MKTWLHRFMLLTIVALTAAASNAQPDPNNAGDLTDESRLANAFRGLIEKAKQRVYPALVFVKPIREESSRGEKTRREVFGSGVIISPDGFAVTNNHVIDNAIEIRVVLSDKRQVPAKLIGTDPETDLALLQLEGLEKNETLPYSQFADSETVKSGDFVMALGSPFGYARSISLGIVSNTERYLGFESKFIYNTFIQTDAAINPGNSGGPLVNLDGEIVGINTLAVTGGQGLGFSVPSTIVREVTERLRVNKRVDRSWIGIKLQPLRDYRTNTFTNSKRGALVSHVEPDSPTAKAGVKAGDILQKVNGQDVSALYAEDLPELERILADLEIGSPSKLTLRRGAESVELAVTASLKGSIDLQEFVCKRWNMTLKEFNEFSEPDLYFHQKGGVFVFGVRRPGNASSSGLRTRDIVVMMDRKPVKTIADARTIYEAVMKDAKRKPRVVLQVRRGAFQLPIVLNYKEDFLD